MGRNDKLFCYEYYRIIPDILTLAKSLGRGFPISTMLTMNKVASVIKPLIHGIRYGKNTLSYSVAESVIDIINTKKFFFGVIKKSKKIIFKLNIINQYFKLFKKIRVKNY